MATIAKNSGYTASITFTEWPEYGGEFRFRPSPLVPSQMYTPCGFCAVSCLYSHLHSEESYFFLGSVPSTPWTNQSISESCWASAP
jgi:hypothetical protein